MKSLWLVIFTMFAVSGSSYAEVSWITDETIFVKKPQKCSVLVIEGQEIIGFDCKDLWVWEVKSDIQIEIPGKEGTFERVDHTSVLNLWKGTKIKFNKEVKE